MNLYSGSLVWLTCAFQIDKTWLIENLFSNGKYILRTKVFVKILLFFFFLLEWFRVVIQTVALKSVRSGLNPGLAFISLMTLDKLFNLSKFPFPDL